VLASTLPFSSQTDGTIGRIILTPSSYAGLRTAEETRAEDDDGCEPDDEEVTIMLTSSEGGDTALITEVGTTCVNIVRIPVL
jgi:hypothetical protein